MSMVETLRLVISGDSAGAQRALSQLEGKATGTTGKLGSTMSGLNKAANIAALGFVGLGAAVGMSVKSYADLAISTGKLSVQTGMSAEGASQLIGQFQMLHVNSSSVGMAIKTLEKNIYGLQTGSSASVAAFKILGLSWDDLKGKSPADQLSLIRDRLSEVQDPAARTAAATTLLGRGASSMAFWYGASAAQIKQVNAALKANGQILSETDYDNAKKAAESWQALVGALKGLEYAVGKSALPYLTFLAAAVRDVVNDLRPFAPVVVPATIALGAFVAVVKTAVFFQKTWGQALGFTKWGADATAIGIDTAAVEANTVALTENDAARAFGYSMGGGTGTAGARIASNLGGDVGPVAGGGSTLGAFGTMAAGAAAAASAAATGAFIYYLATYKQPGTEPSASTITGGGAIGGRGPASGTIGAGGSAAAQAIGVDQARVAREVAGTSKLNAIIKEINSSKPSAENVGRTAVWEKQLKDLATTYPELAGQISATEKAVEKGSKAFEQAAAAAAALAESIRTAYKSMKDFNAATLQAALMGKSLPSPAQAAYASQSDQAAGGATLAQQLSSGQLVYTGTDPVTGAAMYRSVKTPKKQTAAQKKVVQVQSGGRLEPVHAAQGTQATSPSSSNDRYQAGQTGIVQHVWHVTIHGETKSAKEIVKELKRQVSHDVRFAR